MMSRLIRAGVVGVLLAVSGPVFSAQVDYFLKIDGVKGESKAMKGTVENGKLFLVGEDGRKFSAGAGQYKRQRDGRIVGVGANGLLLPAIQKFNPAATRTTNPRGVVAPID